MTFVTFKLISTIYFCDMKKWIFFFAVSLSALIIFNMLRVSFTFIYYELDPIGFIEELCENKDKPELQCNGKCHLKKVAQTTGDKNEPVKIVNFEELLLFKQDITGYKLQANFYSLKRENFTYLNLYNFSYKSSCFHPPQV